MSDRWISIGPTGCRDGVGATRALVSGRVTAIVVSSSGSRVYIGTAAGGVWRSDDQGQQWRPMMDNERFAPGLPSALDLNTGAAVVGASGLAIGAIACVPDDPDRLYVGTGEFSADDRSYRGVGMLMSDDGGDSWVGEPAHRQGDATHTLDGAVVFQIAIEPGSPDRAMAATSRGAYRREANGTNADGEPIFRWSQVRAGHCNSVVVAREGGQTTWYIQMRGEVPRDSVDYGTSWNAPIATNASAGAIAATDDMVLAVRPSDRDIVYALVADGRLLRIDRNAATPQWHGVTGMPGTQVLVRIGFATTPVAAGNFGQPEGGRHLALTVHPTDPNRVVIGGARARTTNGRSLDWSAALYHGRIRIVSGAPRISYVNIGRAVPAYINALAQVPAHPEQLWAGSEGGVFYSANHDSAGEIFEPRNSGLDNVVVNALAQHPTEECLVWAATDGTAFMRYTGFEAWASSHRPDASYDICSGARLGDAAAVAVRRDDPFQLLVAAPDVTDNNAQTATVVRMSNGGANPDAADMSIARITLAAGDAHHRLAPVASNPFPPAAAANADRDGQQAAFGTRQLWSSNDFGNTWTAAQGLRAAPITAIAFGNHDLVYVGTQDGEIWRYTTTGGAWDPPVALHTQNNLPSGASRIQQPIRTIAVHPQHRDQIYIGFAGNANHPRVWHYNGTAWSDHQGGAGAALPQTPVHALAINLDDPNIVYAGTDQGVWQHDASANTWAPIHEGLPEVPVRALGFHQRTAPTSVSLLRAGTFGRGVYERQIAADVDEVRLYLRDHVLDVGLSFDHGLDPANLPVDPTDDNADPSQRRRVSYASSPDIKVDTPDLEREYEFDDARVLDYLTFTDTFRDEAAEVAMDDEALVSRVYVQVHNRGSGWARDVRVMLIVARLEGGAVPELPLDFQFDVQRGVAAADTGPWRTLGVSHISDVRPGVPGVARFDLPNATLRQLGEISIGSQFMLVALVHHDQDALTAEDLRVGNLAESVRKVGRKIITMATIVEQPVRTVAGAPLEPSTWTLIGPSAMRRGQSAGRTVMSGRASSIAISANGNTVIVGSANGGVWRRVRTAGVWGDWESLMSGFDVNPGLTTSVAFNILIRNDRGASSDSLNGTMGLDSLAVGAVAIDPARPQRIYVGTGEKHILGGHLGVGPVVSDDGGAKWTVEEVEGGHLIGAGFYALAVDPQTPDRVVAATERGIYRREPVRAGSTRFIWRRQTVGATPQDVTFTGVAVARQGGVTRFFAVVWGGACFTSTDGASWTPMPAFPAGFIGRVTLATQPTNTSLLLALDNTGRLLRGVFSGGAWQPWQNMGNMPPNFPRDQGDYNQGLALSPSNANIVFVGGSWLNVGGSNFTGDVWQLRLHATNATVAARTFVGRAVHPDIH